ncbi:MAG: archaetidylserine decarboxylase [Lentisphaeraceae bacterium]|nr:archaetidylserine decarboxylase [Lentisphaeraceae bacterium]
MKSLHLLFLHLLPKNLSSRFVGALASRSISKIAIRWFAKRYKINLDEAAEPISSFKTLNDFFTRKLKDGARPIAEAENTKAVVSPVDGKIAQFGKIEDGRIIQAKGRHYTVQELLGDDEEAKPFINGTFMTIYLAPTDYHRMHHYMDGEITGFRYIPGTLFPVNPFSVQHIEKLFPINERLTTYYDCAGEKAAIVKVGATIVGKIKVSYSDAESNISKKVRAETFENKISIKKGDELGYFAMGSTVVMLFPEESFNFIEKLPLDEKVRVGQILGHWK